jgi:hypothetical protein
LDLFIELTLKSCNFGPRQALKICTKKSKKKKVKKQRKKMRLNEWKHILIFLQEIKEKVNFIGIGLICCINIKEL